MSGGTGCESFVRRFLSFFYCALLRRMPSLASFAVWWLLAERVVSLPAPWGSWWPYKGHGKGDGGINVQLGPRPYYLVNDMDEGDLKDKLESCTEGPFSTSSFSIAHRGAPLQFPEHTKEGYIAGARMGAGKPE